jgi:hypothetical protein
LLDFAKILVFQASTKANFAAFRPAAIGGKAESVDFADPRTRSLESVAQNAPGIAPTGQVDVVCKLLWPQKQRAKYTVCHGW